MRGVPEQVTVKDTRIMVKMNNMNMPLPKAEYKRIFGREPRDEAEARQWALRLRKGREMVRMDNIKTKSPMPKTEARKEKRKNRIEMRRQREAGIMKMELNKVRMKDEGADYPTMMECIRAAVENGCAIVERDEGEKGELNLKLNIGGARLKIDSSGQKAAMEKIQKIMDTLGIDGSTKVVFSDS